MRARGWKAGAVGVGDRGFGCARKTKLVGGPGLQREERGDARAVSEGWLTRGPRWQAVRG